MKWALKPLALHFVVRASRVLAIAWLGTALLASPGLIGPRPRPAEAQSYGDTWLNRNYFARGSDGFTAELLANAERNHLSQETFWKRYRGGQLESALGDLKYVLLVFPNHPRALHLMTMVCKVMKDSATPIVYFEKATRLFPNEPYTFAQYGGYLVSKGETEAGIARLKDALRLNPNLTYALGLLAEAEKKQRAGAGGAATPGTSTHTPAPANPSTSLTPTPSSGTSTGSKPGTTER